MNRPPQPDEYGAYFGKYIALAGDGPILPFLEDQRRSVHAWLGTIPDDKGTTRYAPDKWSLKQVVGHMIDTERIMSYRALCIARGETAPLPGFDQDGYVREANFDALSMEQLRSQFDAVRRATLSLLASLPEEAWSRVGNANHNRVTVRALAYIIAGHLQHHVNLIRSRYMAESSA